MGPTRSLGPGVRQRPSSLLILVFVARITFGPCALISLRPLRDELGHVVFARLNPLAASILEVTRVAQTRLEGARLGPKSLVSVVLALTQQLLV